MVMSPYWRGCDNIQRRVSLLNSARIRTSFNCLHVVGLADGRQAVYDAVIKALQQPNLEPQTMGQLLKSMLDIMQPPSQVDPLLKLRSSIELGPSMSRILDHDDYREISGDFMAGFTSRR